MEGLFYLFVALTMYSQGPETEQTLWTGFQGKPGLHRSPEVPPAHPPGKEGPDATLCLRHSTLAASMAPEESKGAPGMADKQA